MYVSILGGDSEKSSRWHGERGGSEASPFGYFGPSYAVFVRNLSTVCVASERERTQ